MAQRRRDLGAQQSCTTSLGAWVDAQRVLLWKKKSLKVPWEGHPHSWFTFPRCTGRMRALSAGKSQHQSLR